MKDVNEETKNLFKDTRKRYQQMRKAFEKAVVDGRLSHNENSVRWIGDWMYMFTDKNGVDMFKHKDSRQYLSTDQAQPETDDRDQLQIETDYYDELKRDRIADQLDSGLSADK